MVMDQIKITSISPSLSLLEALEITQGNKQGLTLDEAQFRLNSYGRNEVPSSRPPHIFLIFFHQFLDPLIYILIAVAGISLFLNHYNDAIIIFIIVLINAIIGTTQEYNAGQSALSLENMAATKSLVLREGKKIEIDSKEIVIGDIVILESGMKVPADIRLITTQGLEVDESILTGESLSVSKDEGFVVKNDAAIGDRKTFAFAGTLVTRGRAEGVVVGTGLQTELGKIAENVLTHQSVKTPLLLRMADFTKKLSLIFLGLMIIIGFALFLRGQSFIEILLLTVALGVSAIPEGLPVVLTLTLAIASKKMSRRNVIVKKLAAVEALGSCTFIGTDKTGTLTVNELTVKEIVFPSGLSANVTGSGLNDQGEIKFSSPANPEAQSGRDSHLKKFCLAGVLCNESVLEQNADGRWHGQGDAVDLSLLILAYKSKMDVKEIRDHYLLIDQIPYEPEIKYAATFHQNKMTGEKIISVKGALERVLLMCETASIPKPLSEIEQQMSDLAARGLRVLALAGKNTDSFNKENLKELTFLGLVGMIDPLRPDALEAINACFRSGIQVAMITGDHPVTALAIAKDLNLTQQMEEVVTGTELIHAQGIKEFDQLIKKGKVFARVGPQQKLEIVESLIRQGHFVAVTGDGANDAPALKAGHVGIAMGERGSDVSKETASLIITDDRFSSIVAGIEEGRVAYANIRKVVYLLISTGLSEVMLFSLCIIFGLPMPLTAIQLLWLNLVTNGIQDKALAFEPKEGNELSIPPRSPKESIFNRLMVERVSLSAVTIGVVAFIYSQYLLDQNNFSQFEIQNHLLLLMVFFENILIGNARSETHSSLKLNPFRNKFLLFGTLLAQLVHFLAQYIPFLQKSLGVSPLSANFYLKYLLISTSVFFAMELHKYFWKKRMAIRGQ